jgi:hypothetical protein
VRDQIIQSLRWIAVLPAAIAGFAVAQITVLIGGLFVPDFLCQLWSAWVCPIGFVLAGVFVAPKFKFVVALILTTLMTAMMSVTIFLVLSSGRVPLNGNKWWFLFTCVASLVAPIWFCAKLHRDDDEGLLSE